MTHVLQLERLVRLDVGIAHSRLDCLALCVYWLRNFEAPLRLRQIRTLCLVGLFLMTLIVNRCTWLLSYRDV